MRLKHVSELQVALILGTNRLMASEEVHLPGKPVNSTIFTFLPFSIT